MSPGFLIGRDGQADRYRPILTPKTVLPLFFAIGVIFAPIGGILFWANTKVRSLSQHASAHDRELTRYALQVKEIKIDYTNCLSEANEISDGFKDIPSKYIDTSFTGANSSIDAQWAIEKDVKRKLISGRDFKTTRCHIRFNLPEDMTPPVLFYYFLTNFYQNHRRYVDSFDTEQLQGKARSYSQIHDSKCTPLYGDKKENKPYYPCGLIANSLFNDTFTSPVLRNPPGESGNKTKTYEMKNNTGISWDSDRDLYGKTDYKYDEVIPPPNWRDMYPDGYTEKQPPPNLKEWEGFQVWMRTAGLPTFSKLYQRNDDDRMIKGEYEVIIDDCELDPRLRPDLTRNVLLMRLQISR